MPQLQRNRRVIRTSTIAPVRSFVLTEDLCERLVREAERTGLKHSELVRRALGAHLPA